MWRLAKTKAGTRLLSARACLLLSLRVCLWLGTLACVLSSLAAPGCAQTTSGAAPSASNAGGLSFEQIYELAARDNLQINAVRQRRAVAEAGIQIARQRPNPELITGYTRSEPRLNYSVSQPLELGGKRARRIEVARNELRLTELDVDAALRTLRRDVRVVR
ncbi:MAG TPA: TolC family protein [Pyrinomonadaceae bacterium]|nr:TolC family protein [Pyrinomonadaceae bacterium]